MCIHSAPAAPAPPPLPPPPPPPPTAADPRVRQARTRNRKRSLLSGSDDVFTSQQGDLSIANTEKKSLLGS